MTISSILKGEVIFLPVSSISFKVTRVIGIFKTNKYIHIICLINHFHHQNQPDSEIDFTNITNLGARNYCGALYYMTLGLKNVDGPIDLLGIYILTTVTILPSASILPSATTLISATILTYANLMISMTILTTATIHVLASIQILATILTLPPHRLRLSYAPRLPCCPRRPH